MKAIFCKSDTQIGLVVDASRNSVSIWLNIYKSEGFERRCKLGYGANVNKLKQHSASILDSFKISRSVNVAQAVSRIEDITGIKQGAT